MSLTIGCGRQMNGPHRIGVEMGLQGVPQTGKKIKVKRRLSGSFFFELRLLGSVVWGCMGRSDVSGALVIFTDMAQSELKLFTVIDQRLTSDTRYSVKGIHKDDYLNFFEEDFIAGRI